MLRMLLEFRADVPNCRVFVLYVCKNNALYISSIPILFSFISLPRRLECGLPFSLPLPVYKSIKDIPISIGELYILKALLMGIKRSVLSFLFYISISS